MRRLFFMFFAAMIAVCSVQTDAEARRGGGKGGYIVPIPGFSSSETIVKVLDLPDTMLLKRADGKYIDLGYLHQSGGKGKWIGYIGSSTTYVPMTEKALEALLLIAGVDELPPVPEKKSSGGAWVWALIGAFIVAPKVLKKLSSGGSGSRAQRARREVPEDETDLDWDHVDAMIREAAKTSNSAGRTAAASPRRAAPGSGARKGFGRRGA